MSFRDELIEAGARAMLAKDSEADGFDADNLPWEAAGEHLQGIYLEAATVALDAMLAYRTTDECPTCGGTGWWNAYGHGPCPDCTDGRVPRDFPCLAVLGGMSHPEVVMPDDVPDWGGKVFPATFILAPDLPEGTP